MVRPRRTRASVGARTRWHRRIEGARGGNKLAGVPSDTKRRRPLSAELSAVRVCLLPSILTNLRSRRLVATTCLSELPRKHSHHFTFSFSQCFDLSKTAERRPSRGRVSSRPWDRPRQGRRTNTGDISPDGVASYQMKRLPRGLPRRPSSDKHATPFLDDAFVRQSA